MIPLRDFRPSGSFPLVTVLIIALNALVFFYELSLSGQTDAKCSYLLGQFVSQHNCFFFQYGLVPHWLLSSPGGSFALTSLPLWTTVFTSMFVHANFLHILGNMWFLWIFGDNVEDAFGSLNYLFFYLFCGLMAALSQVLSDPGSQVPMIGASGAIAGVMGAYMMLYPWGRVRTLLIIIIIDLPAVVILGIWLGVQIFVPQGGVAAMAHVGGFTTGALIAWLLKRLRRRRAPADYSFW